MLLAIGFIYEPDDLDSYVNIVNSNNLFDENIYFEFGSKTFLTLMGFTSLDIIISIYCVCFAILYYLVLIDPSFFRKLCWVPLIGMYYGENLLFNQFRMSLGLTFFILWYINLGNPKSYIFILFSSFFHIIYITPLILYFASHRNIWLLSVLITCLLPLFFQSLVDYFSIIEKIYFYNIIEGSNTFIIFRMALFISFVLVVKKFNTNIIKDRLLRSYLIYFLAVILLFDFLPVVFGRISSLIILSEPFIVCNLTKNRFIYGLYLIILLTLGVMRIWLQY
jgi:hypothetical protein